MVLQRKPSLLACSDDPVCRFFQHGVIWTVVVSISAAPSFLWGRKEYDIGGMLCGTAVFILAYTVASITEFAERLNEAPFVRRTLLIGFALRLGASVIFPIGMALDILPGIFAVSFVESVFGKDKGFTPTLCITLLQGVFLNALLGAFLVMVYGLQRAFLKAPIKVGLCRCCGYDLRVQLKNGIPQCPECGTLIPPSTSPAT